MHIPRKDNRYRDNIARAIDIEIVVLAKGHGFDLSNIDACLVTQIVSKPFAIAKKAF